MYITSIANGVCQFSGAKGRGGKDFSKGGLKKSLLGGGEGRRTDKNNNSVIADSFHETCSQIHAKKVLLGRLPGGSNVVKFQNASAN